MSKQEGPSVIGFLADFTAGGISGAVAQTVTIPLDNVHRSKFYRPHETVARLWAKHLTNVIRFFPTRAFNFAFKDQSKQFFPIYNPKIDFGMLLLINMLSGGLAGAGSLCIMYPVDFALTRLALDMGSGKRSFRGLADCLVKTAKEPAGIMGLYHGFGVSLAAVMPYRAVYFGMFDTLASINPCRNDRGVLAFTSKFVIAQTTAIVASYVSYPFDTIRRRLQMQSERPPAARIYSGAVDCLTKITQQEGVSLLFKGAGTNAWRTISTALVLVLYDEVKPLLRNI